MSIKGIFIAGTDTGVGKTFIAARLVRILRDRGINAGVWKPVQSGYLPGDPNADSYQLKHISGVDDDEREICPFSFETPVTPWLAARLEGKELLMDELIEKGRLLFSRYAVIVVEGAGGLAVPLTAGGLIVTMAAELGFPLLLIARPGLGTINHSLLSIAYARQHGLNVMGVILNGYDQMPESVSSLERIQVQHEFSDSLSTNPLFIKRFGKTSILGMVPKMAPEAPATAVAQSINVDQIVRELGV